VCHCLCKFFDYAAHLHNIIHFLISFEI
jgi:hypothetical protein